jgi:hypothetical protein
MPGKCVENLGNLEVGSTGSPQEQNLRTVDGGVEWREVEYSFQNDCFERRTRVHSQQSKYRQFIGPFVAYFILLYQAEQEHFSRLNLYTCYTFSALMDLYESPAGVLQNEAIELLRDVWYCVENVFQAVGAKLHISSRCIVNN